MTQSPGKSQAGAARSHDGKRLVFISTRGSDPCGECKEPLGKGDWITLEKEKGALCLECSDLDHLEYLPAGDAALTRRATKHSTLTAVVLEWSRSRKRYERQGILVEDAALVRAEEECLADADARERRREREADRREAVDEKYVSRFAERIAELYPRLPADEVEAIARHACEKHSGRVGRSAAAKELDADAVRLAVGAHARHVHTDYDRLLARGEERHEARSQVGPLVRRLLAEWSGGADGDEPA
ncbi:MAG: DUF2293 domain-containing protein [Deltaproteobacteria bacterium]|nr:DUF2293 domain-containing protein [Deltaproteobacteria bacterium]